MDNEIWRVVSERFDYEVAHTAHIDEDVCGSPGSTPPRRQRMACLSLPHEIDEHMSSSPPSRSWRSQFVSCLVSILFI